MNTAKDDNEYDLPLDEWAKKKFVRTGFLGDFRTKWKMRFYASYVKFLLRLVAYVMRSMSPEVRVKYVAQCITSSGDVTRKQLSTIVERMKYVTSDRTEAEECVVQAIETVATKGFWCSH